MDNVDFVLKVFWGVWLAFIIVIALATPSDKENDND